MEALSPKKSPAKTLETLHYRSVARGGQGYVWRRSGAHRPLRFASKRGYSTGSLTGGFTAIAGKLAMSQVTAQADYKIDLGEGLSLWLATPQQQAAARFVTHEIFTKQRYDHPGFQIQPTDTVVDIGANMGIFALWAARRAARGKVLAIEPTSAIDVLRMNLQRNGISNVIPIQAACGPDGGTFEIVTYPGFNIVNHHAGWQPKMWTKFFIWLLYRKYQSDPVIERANVKSLKHLLDENGMQRVNYLKCDCEGGEYEIFRDLDDDTFARIDKIAMEFHEYAPGQDRNVLIDLLKRHGFDVKIEKSWFEYTFMKYGMLWATRKNG